MFDNFLRALGKGKPESVQLEKLFEDLEELNVFDLPGAVPTLEWLKTTEWYKSGGYKEVRAAAACHTTQAYQRRRRHVR